MNDVAPLVQMMCFAMMRATSNDVALRANGIEPFAQCAEMLLIFNRKYDIIISTNSHKTLGLSRVFRYNGITTRKERENDRPEAILSNSFLFFCLYCDKTITKH